MSEPLLIALVGAGGATLGSLLGGGAAWLRLGPERRQLTSQTLASGVRTSLESLQAALAQGDQDAAELRTELSSLRAENAALRAENAELRAENRQQRDRIDAQDRRLTALERRLAPDRTTPSP